MKNISLRKGQLAMHRYSNSLCRIDRNDGYTVDAVILELEHVPGAFPYLSRLETEFVPIMQDGALFTEELT